jgi:hypothetical protein
MVTDHLREHTEVDPSTDIPASGAAKKRRHHCAQPKRSWTACRSGSCSIERLNCSMVPLTAAVQISSALPAFGVTDVGYASRPQSNTSDALGVQP